MKRLKEIVVDEYIKAINEMPSGCDGCHWPGDEGKEDDKKDKEVLLSKKVEEGKLLRWKIFVKETEAFIEDVKKLVDFIKPYIVKAVDKVKEIYGKVKAKIQK